MEAAGSSETSEPCYLDTQDLIISSESTASSGDQTNDRLTYGKDLPIIRSSYALRVKRRHSGYEGSCPSSLKKPYNLKTNYTNLILIKICDALQGYLLVTANGVGLEEGLRKGGGMNSCVDGTG